MIKVNFRFSLIILLLAILGVASALNDTQLSEILAVNQGPAFPYKEMLIYIAGADKRVLFVPDGTNDQCIKAAEVRCDALEQQGIPCIIYRLVSLDYDYSGEGVEQGDSEGLIPKGSKYNLTIRVDANLEKVTSDEDEYKKVMPEIEKQIKSSNVNAKFVFLVSRQGGGKFVYTGNGGISKLERGTTHYAYLYNDRVDKKVDMLSGADLRNIERARQLFIEYLGRMDGGKLNERHLAELAARLRALDSVLNSDGSCKKCLELTKSCSHCSNFVSSERSREYYNLAKKFRKYDVSIETRISKHVKKGVYASLFVMSNVNDSRIPSFSQSIRIGSMGNVKSSTVVPSNLGVNCQGLSEQDLVLVRRMVSLFNVYFEKVTLRSDYDELCIAVSQMSKSFSDKSRRPVSPYSVETCAAATALSLGNFYPSFMSDTGGLDPTTENSLIIFCSAVLRQEPLGLVENLSPVYSPSGTLVSPTGGKLDAAILLIKSRSEEAVITSLLEGSTCSLRDLFNAGWKFDKKLKIWVRGNNNRIPLPIMVRYGLTEDGKLAAFSLEGRDAYLYSKGADVLKTDPVYTPTYSSLIGDRCLSPSNVENLKNVSKVYEHETLIELNEAKKNVELAALNSREASKTAAEAVTKYEEAIENEKKAMELAKLATEFKNYHDAKLKASQRAAELAKLEERLIDASEKRARAANISAKALIEASEAETRRREASNKARLAAERATEHIKAALDIQKQLKLQLKQDDKLRASYESAIITEDRLRIAHNEAQESLEKIIRNEREINSNFEKDMRLLIEEEERLRKCIEEYASRRVALLQKLEEISAALTGKVEESKRFRDKLREEARLKQERVEAERAELGKLSNLMLSQSAEVTAVSVSIKESEILLKEMELIAEQKAKEAEEAKQNFVQMSIKIKELHTIYETLTIKVQGLSSNQKDLEESVKTAEQDLKHMLEKLSEVEAKISRLEESRAALDEKSKEATELLAKETLLISKVEEIKRRRSVRRQELEKLLKEQADVKSEISALLVARNSALSIIRKTLNDIEEARAASQGKTAEMRSQYKKTSILAEESMKSVESLREEVCRALSEEELKSKDLQEKIKCVNRMDLEVRRAEDELSKFSQTPAPEVPLTPQAPRIKCEVIE
ncbi:coiled coil [Cryptosporidium sp. chipmunk genotype I]|uniref:coiled coil n=1 Tax=Cryptosporidium sp. chipmunk genotype I TaxID=1280935 RepID=UPI00351A1FA6|nr:coiled coil [Cryptosporidium sp. chipmunk genotype I]